MDSLVLKLLTLYLALAVQPFCSEIASVPPLSKPDKSTIAQLRVDLINIFNEDRENSVEIGKTAKAHGYKSAEMDRLKRLIAERNIVSLRKVTEILDCYGWISPKEIGAEASVALFLKIKEADFGTQKKYLPILRAALKERKINASQLVVIEDHVALTLSGKQLYGSQLRQDPKDGHFFVSPIENPEHVDERRAALGLEPMADYLKHWNLAWDAENYKSK